MLRNQLFIVVARECELVSQMKVEAARAGLAGNVVVKINFLLYQMVVTWLMGVETRTRARFVLLRLIERECIVYNLIQHVQVVVVFQLLPQFVSCTRYRTLVVEKALKHDHPKVLVHA